MAKKKINLTLSKRSLEYVDKLVLDDVFPNRSVAIEFCIKRQYCPETMNALKLFWGSLDE